MPDLATCFRPQVLSEVIGQPATSILNAWITENEIPHVVLFHGPSGVGKTTLARILAKAVGAKLNDITEIDVADERGIDMARDLIDQTGPWSKPLPPSIAKVVIIDEVVQLPETTQQAMLTMLEEPEDWVYFFLCTTKLTKLLDAFKSRCKIIKLQCIPARIIHNRLDDIACKIESPMPSPILQKIAEHASGNMRTALNLLERTLAIQDEQQQLRSLSETETETDDTPKNVAELCRLLLNPTPLKEVFACLDAITDSPETVRIRVLAYMNRVLRGGNDRATTIIRIFQYDFSQYAAVPQAGLALACRDVFAARTLSERRK